jgi:hypothetical protein
MTPYAVQRFVNSRAGKVIAWTTVLFAGSVAVRAVIYFGYNFWQDTLTAADSAVLVFGLVAAWAGRVAYRTLIQPGQASGRNS